jgi:hypothetical protein
MVQVAKPSINQEQAIQRVLAVPAEKWSPFNIQGGILVSGKPIADVGLSAEDDYYKYRLNYRMDAISGSKEFLELELTDIYTEKVLKFTKDDTQVFQPVLEKISKAILANIQAQSARPSTGDSLPSDFSFRK